MISKPKIPHVHRIYMVLANPTCIEWDYSCIAGVLSHPPVATAAPLVRLARAELKIASGQPALLWTCKAGLFSSFFWEQGFDKFCERSKTLELFEGFKEQFWETALELLPPPLNLPNWLCMLINHYRGKKGPEWDHVIIVEQKKEKLEVQCKCRVLQILSSSEMCDKFGLNTKKTSWPDTDTYFIYKI